MIAALVIGFALLGGWLSRMCGGAPPKLPLGLDQWLYALPYLLIGIPAIPFIVSALRLPPKHRQVAGFCSLEVSYLGAFAGKRTGHGNGFDLGHAERGKDDEALEFIVQPLHGKIPEYWYDALLVAVTGLAVTLAAGIVVSVINPLAGVLLALSGLSKAPAYMIGWAIYPNHSGKGIPYLNESTAIGEFLTGFFGYGFLGIAAAMIWGMA